MCYVNLCPALLSSVGNDHFPCYKSSPESYYPIIQICPHLFKKYHIAYIEDIYDSLLIVNYVIVNRC